MAVYVARTCTKVGKDDSKSVPLAEFRESSAYVLLGPPGAGKTTEFEREAKSHGTVRETARDFPVIGPAAREGDAPRFIDGLDESRAGTDDGRAPLDAIRQKLEELGRPRFRLSCREADWFGENDRARLEQVSPDGELVVLRLDPLDEEGAHEFLGGKYEYSGKKAHDFLAEAKRKGLESLLGNPQSLQMLVDAVEGRGEWPETRKQAFEMACMALAKELNDEHLFAKRNQKTPAIPQLIDTAGRLCAIQLLVGAEGFVMPGFQGGKGHLDLGEISGGNRELFLQCLQTKLFEAPTEGCAGVIHRQVAEFLAGQYLAALVKSGLPLARVLALIAPDGAPPTALRGLSAWLAAHAISQNRSEIASRDPFGTVLYGDARSFSTGEKRELLEGIQQIAQQHPFLQSDLLPLDARLGDLATPDMADTFRQFLDPSSLEGSQAFLLIAVVALTHGRPMPRIADRLLELIRNGSVAEKIRTRAISAYLVQREGEEDRKAALGKLRVLAKDIVVNKVSDPGFEVLGKLLMELYPAVISARDIIGFLSVPIDDNCHSYWEFWNLHVPQNSSPEQLATLLDGFVARFGGPEDDQSQHHPVVRFFKEIPGKLLEKYFELAQDTPPLDRLKKCPELASRFRESLRDHKSFEERVEKGDEVAIAKKRHNSFLQVKSQQESLLANEARPALLDYLARTFLGEAAPSLASGFASAAGKFLPKATGVGADARCRERFLLLAKLGNSIQSSDRKDKDLCEAILSVFRGRADLSTRRERLMQLLNGDEDLCKVILEVWADLPKPKDHLMGLLNGDEDLYGAVLTGFRGTLERTNLPTHTEIAELASRNRRHLLLLPFLAGIHELESAVADGNIRLDEKHDRLLIAMLCEEWPRLAAPKPARLDALFRDSPELVADTLIHYARITSRHNGEWPRGIVNILGDGERREVARLAALPLLQGFPVRAPRNELWMLNNLLGTARECLDRVKLEKLAKLVERKLGRRSMTVRQRACWLVASVSISSTPDFFERLGLFSPASEESRIRCVAEAVLEQGVGTQAVREGNIPLIDWLIACLGAAFQQYDFDSEGGAASITLPMRVSLAVYHWIMELAALPGESATSSLDTLSSNPSLLSWRPVLREALRRQLAVRRDATFEYSTVEQVQDTLDGKAPANAADLAALTFA